MKTTLTSLFAFILSLTVQVSSAQFKVTGNAADISSDARPHSFQLTSEIKGQKGTMWHTSKINLTDHSWTIAFKAYFGKKENKGSDGIALVFQNDPRGIHTTGKAENGKHMGFYGIKPSLMVEFDTSNDGLTEGDIAEDHIAISKNGSTDKEDQLTQPVSAKANKSSIEDNLEHPVKVEWNADNNTLSVYFDEILRQTYTGDVVNEIFEGNSDVYYGFTGSSNKSKNKHLIYDLSATPAASNAAKNNTTLPVILINFQGAATNTETVLTWATAMEKNSDYFHVEQSSNGKTWTVLARITSKTNSNTQNKYTYTDASANGLSYYRLKMVDLDGTAEYSKIITVNSKNMKAGLTCYPNPVQHAQTLNIAFNAANETTIIVSDITGKLVNTQIIKTQGSQTIQVETAGLKPGMYFVNLVSGLNKEMARVVIQ